MTRLFRRFLLFAGCGLGAYVLITLVVAMLQDRFLYFPERMSEDRPADTHLPFRDLSFSASDGAKLHAWFFPATHPRATLLHAHGNAGHLGHRIFVVRPLLDLGLNVLLFDYRGYGKSEGSPGEQGLYRDAAAALIELEGQPEAAAHPVVYYGESLGGAVATQLAVDHPPAALILQSTFTSVPDMASQIFPWLPARWLVRDRYASIEKVSKLSCPVLVIHGTRDSVVPFAMGQRLFAAVPVPKKRFLAVEGADHNDVWGHEPVVVDAIRALLVDAGL